MGSATSRAEGLHDAVDELITLAQTAERQAQRELARTHYEAALRRLDRSSPPSLAAGITRWIGRTYLEESDFDAASDCFELSEAIAKASGDVSGVAHASNWMGILSQTRGDLDEAVELYQEARRHGIAAEDLKLVSLIDQNLGIVANIRGDFASALECYRTSLLGFRSVGLEVQVAAVLNNLGMLYTDLQRWEEAEQAYTEALDVCARNSDASTQIIVEVNRAELWIAQKVYDRALASCDAALRLSEAIGEVRQLGEMHKHYGVIFRETANLDRAEEHLALAARIAEDRQDLLLAAEIAREQADLFWRQQRNQETLQFLNRAHRYFTQLRARRDLADIAGRMANLEKMFLEIVHRWGESIESKDRYTQGHCQRVADYACALAEAVGFDGQILLWFRMGALLHDVGKIVVPTEVLNKAGRFTSEERSMMERHPDAGVELLRDMDFPWDIRPMVRHHHEWWSGGGYPDRLSGDEIPLSARILCIADVYDALTTDRPYRPGYSRERAIEIMEADTGRIFDPDLFPVFKELARVGIVDGPLLPAPQKGDSGDPAQWNTIRMLLVEDSTTEVSLLPMVESADRGVPIELVRVERLSDAVRRLGDEEFDVVLLDLTLPDSRGLATLIRLRAQAYVVPIVVVTDVYDEAFALQAVQGGAQDYLVKGQVDRNLLMRSVRYAIERHRLQMELRKTSLVDDLTGIYNRRGFFTLAQQHIKLADRTRRGFMLVFADLDGLKQINDTLGHQEGDQALIDTARLLEDAFPVSDIIARIGGDEFVVLTIASAAADAEVPVAQLREKFAAHNASGERPYHLSLSVGVASYNPEHPCSIDELLSRADALMYERKRSRSGTRAER